MDFSDKLKLICKEEKINLREFSDITGIPHATVKQYSSGRRSPHWPQINQIAAHPRFEKYAQFLLSSNEIRGPQYEYNAETVALTDDEAEFIDLFRKMEKEGRGEELKAFLNLMAKKKL